MQELIKIYRVQEDISLENDGVIGIPVKLTVLFDIENFKVTPGYRQTPIIIYVINTSTERVGTESDEAILERMIRKGYVILLMDYNNSPLSKCPKLDFSVQQIRRRIISGEFFINEDVFPKGNYSETLVVPAGYDVYYNKPYWSYDQHGADGDFEKIVEIWNNDFRGTKAEKLIKWTDARGRKKTQIAHDGSAPIWYNENGEESEEGEYIKVKHTLAKHITDIVKPNGDPIELNLYMHLIYPTNPEQPVPVACLNNSSEDLCSGSATADRPHLLGFMFRGYAGVMYDYGYTPMARLDCYGYFDGFPMAGAVTGDNPTYSLQFYNDKRITTAAMRYIRYLAASDDRFVFDTDSICVYGNSKGAWMTFLGEAEPEKMQSKRMYKGHHDETRFENGKTESVGTIRGGEEQPWLSYNGKAISGRANLIYSSCGGLDDAITEGHSPMFISCNRRDGSCYSTSNAMVNACRNHDIPTMWLEIPLGHTIVSGEDLVYKIDAYQAFFDFCAYHLKNEAIKVVGAKYFDCHFPGTVQLLFSGSVSPSEVSKLTVSNADGEKIEGEWKGAFDGTEWTFTPDNHLCGGKYTLNVPSNLKGKNGKIIKSEFSYTFNVANASVVLPELICISESEKNIGFTKLNEAEEHFLTITAKSGTNAIAVYTKEGSKVGYANISHLGENKIDISDYVNALPLGTFTELILKTEKPCESTEVFSALMTQDEKKITFPQKTIYSFDKTPDNVPSLRINGIKTETSYPTEEFYSYPSTLFVCEDIVKPSALKKKDMGRKFKISLKIYDTVSRYVRVELNHCSSREDSIADYYRNCYNIKTEEGKWIDFAFEYTVYEPMYSIDLPKKKLIVSAYTHGNEEKPIYFTKIESSEILSELEYENITLISAPKSKSLPYGVSEIECKKSPWSKK